MMGGTENDFSLGSVSFHMLTMVNFVVFLIFLVTFYFYVLCNKIKNKCSKAFTYLPSNSLGLATNCPFQNT